MIFIITIVITIVAAVSAGMYIALLALLAVVPILQNHVFYLHRVSLIWSKDVTVPEQFGFAPWQVRSFYISCEDDEEDIRLHAWHILPIGTFRRSLKNRSSLRAHDANLMLLRDDNPDTRLVLYFHGTAGCIASGWRPDSYRAIYAAAPEHIHVLTFDYRGYGRSTGRPSERGLVEDGMAVVRWAMEVGRIPSSRIVIYGQSLGTAVAMAVMQRCATLPEPILFAGHVLTAPFSDVATLTASYRIGGVIPVLSPLQRVPYLLAFFNSYLINTWDSRKRLVEYIEAREARESVQKANYYIEFIHAQDDPDISCQHSNVLFWHAVKASSSSSSAGGGGGKRGFEELQRQKLNSRTDYGHGGWVVDHETSSGGLIRQTMLTYGVHDKLMAYSVTSLAVLRAFQAADPAFMI